MFWVKYWAGGAVAALCVAAGAAQAAIVVASSGPSARDYPAGKQLDDAGRITLRAGDSVTILDQRGTRVLQGAGSFSVSQATGPTANLIFLALTRQQSAERVRTGAVRSGEQTGPVRSTNIWYVDLAKSGTTCIVDPGDVRLWRADPAQSARYTVSSPGHGAMAVSFGVGEMVAPWDASRMPVADGARFVVTDPSGTRMTKITFSVLPSQPADSEALAASLIARGCQAQLDLLVASLALDAE